MITKLWTISQKEFIGKPMKFNRVRRGLVVVLQENGISGTTPKIPTLTIGDETDEQHPRFGVNFLLAKTGKVKASTHTKVAKRLGLCCCCQRRLPYD